MSNENYPKMNMEEAIEVYGALDKQELIRVIKNLANRVQEYKYKYDELIAEVERNMV